MAKLQNISAVVMLLTAHITQPASCTLKSNDANTQFAFNLCVAMLSNKPEVAIQTAANYQATASTTNDISTACTWCQMFIQGAQNNNGGMTSGSFDAYSSDYGNLTKINYQALPAILNDAGVFAFINQSPVNKETFSVCFVNQCGVRQVPTTIPVKECAVNCITLAQQYLAWVLKQNLSTAGIQQLKACASDKGCWANGQYMMGCLTPCAVQQKPYKPTVVPWILTQ